MELLIVCALAALLLVYAIERLNSRDSFRVQRYDLDFNGERLRGFCLVLDRRSPEQRQRNQEQSALDGDVLVFMHGHGQPPQYGYHFTSLLTQRSKSGLMVIPMVYTPFGKLPQWRGDQGKTLLLMAIVRDALAQRGISLPEGGLQTDLPLAMRCWRPLTQAQPQILAQVTVVGWSHGGILARRFAHAYPAAVRNLAQITPAGFESWGQGWLAMFNLLLSFQWEVLRIIGRIFRGEAGPALIAGWSILRGIGGDSLSAWKSMLTQRPRPLRLLRPLYDVHQCALVMSDANAPVQQLEHIVVLFGQSDTVFEARNAVPSVSGQSADSDKLFRTYYPSALEQGAQCTFKVLPGNHIAPLVHADLYAHELLAGVEQLRDVTEQMQA